MGLEMGRGERRYAMRSLVGLLLAVVVIGLGACSASDQTTQAEVPAEVEQLIDAYLAA